MVKRMNVSYGRRPGAANVARHGLGEPLPSREIRASNQWCPSTIFLLAISNHTTVSTMTRFHLTIRQLARRTILWSTGSRPLRRIAASWVSNIGALGNIVPHGQSWNSCQTGPGFYKCAAVALLFLLPSLEARAQADYRPGLFFEEGWAEIPAETPVTQEHVAHDELSLELYGPGAEQVKKSHHEQPVDDPYYVWSGQCEGNWAVTLKHETSYADLSEYAKVTWRSKQSGLRCLHLVLKLADGTWLVSEQCDEASSDWRLHQFNLADIDWRSLDIETVVEGDPVEDPDLSRVDEIGFTDLMRGGSTDASSRVDWMRVYGEPVAK